jgi:hypothetical protein
MPMTLARDLIAEARRRLSDRVQPYQHSDADLLAALTEGEEEAAERALLLYDDDTEEVCDYPVVASSARIELHERILQVETATLHLTTGGQPIRLRRQGADWMERQVRDCSGRPHSWAIMRNGDLRLYPTPTANDVGTLHLAVYRHPLAPLTSAGMTPELPGRAHRALVDWVVYRACQPKDGEILNPELAREALTAFERRFGPPRDNDDERRRNERRQFTTTYPGP